MEFLNKKQISEKKTISNWLVHNPSKIVKNKKMKFTHQEIDLNKSAATYVQITAQSVANLEKIENKLGPYECKLCRVVFSNAFALAMHSCPKIYHTLYACDECNKVFNSPANLASHKRWHRPKVDTKFQHITTNHINSPSSPHSPLIINCNNAAAAAAVATSQMSLNYWLYSQFYLNTANCLFDCNTMPFTPEECCRNEFAKRASHLFFH